MDSHPSGPPPDAIDLCAPFLATLPVAGASIGVLVASPARVTLCSSNATAARIDELQFELGEGPQRTAALTGEIAAITDTATRADPRWPTFAAAVAQLPVGAVFCIPIRMGAVTLGVVTLYSQTPRELTHDEQATALAIAAVMAGTAADLAMARANDHSDVSGSDALPALRREVHQATGIMLVQLDVSATDAYARLQAYAFANGRTVQAVAHDVVAGSLIFTDTAHDS